MGKGTSRQGLPAGGLENVMLLLPFCLIMMLSCYGLGYLLPWGIIIQVYISSFSLKGGGAGAGHYYLDILWGDWKIRFG